MLKQPKLFPLATAQPIGRPTWAQLALLDALAFNEGVPIEIGQRERMTLRHLLAKRYITCVALGPAIYRLTPIGRIARGRK